MAEAATKPYPITRGGRARPSNNSPDLADLEGGGGGGGSGGSRGGSKGSKDPPLGPTSYE